MDAPGEILRLADAFCPRYYNTTNSRTSYQTCCIFNYYIIRINYNKHLLQTHFLT